MCGDSNCQHWAFGQLKIVLGDFESHGYLRGHLIWLYVTAQKASCKNGGRADLDAAETRPESSGLMLCFDLADCQSEVKLDKEDGASRAAQERSPAQWAGD